MNLERSIFRAWFYFRQGYGTYLALALGIVSNVVSIYALGIKPAIESGGTLGGLFQALFPHLTNFFIIAAGIGTPVAIYLGLLHMRRTGAFEADAAVSTESNPYVYRTVPGKEQEVFLPMWMLTTQWLAKILDQQNNLSTEEKTRFEQLMSKANELLAGQAVGAPRRLGAIRLGSQRN